MSTHGNLGPVGPRNWTTWASIAAYSYAMLSFGLQVNLLGPTVSVMAQKLGVVEADLGIIFTINGLASIVGAMPSGWLVDKLPGHAVLAAALAFEALGYVCIPLCNSMLALAAAFAAVALSWNIINTAGNTYVLWIAAEAAATKASQRGSSSSSDSTAESSSVLINMVNAVFGAGSLAAPLVAEFCATKLSNPMAAYWITAALTAVSAGSFLLLPSPKPPGSHSGSNGSSSSQPPLPPQAAAAAPDGELQQPLLTGAAAAAGSGVDDDQETPGAAPNGPAAAEAVVSRAAETWWSGSLLLLLSIIALFNLLNVGTEVGFGGWIFTYATKQAGLSEHEGHAVNAAYWGFFTLGRVVASFAALIWSPATLLFASLPVALLGAVAALVAPASLMQQQGWALLMGVTLLVGLGVSAGFANSLALLDSYCPCTGSITGLLGGVAGAGCMTVPLLVALLAKHTSMQYQGLMWVCLVSFAVQLACVPVALLVGNKVKQQRLLGSQDDDYASVTKELGLEAEEQQLQADEC